MEMLKQADLYWTTGINWL